MKVIKHYPYRTGMVYGGTDFPRDLMRPMEEELHKQAGTRIDNHVCFSFADERGNLAAVWFHDLVCIIGEKVEEKRW